MDLLMLILYIAIIGFIVWLITTKIPMGPIFRLIIYVIVAVAAVLFLLRHFAGTVPNVLH